MVESPIVFIEFNGGLSDHIYTFMNVCSWVDES